MFYLCLKKEKLFLPIKKATSEEQINTASNYHTFKLDVIIDNLCTKYISSNTCLIFNVIHMQIKMSF